MVDYVGALSMPVPQAWVFENRNGYTGALSIVVHKTASPGQVSAQQIAEFFMNDTVNMKSAHYVVGQDGTVVQCVLEKDGAGANCCTEPGYDPVWQPFVDKGLNLNLVTISIEHVDPAADNSTPLTDAQKSASFQLIADICKRHNIPSTAIYGHNTIDPESRARCPGNYPLAELQAYVAERNGGNVVKLTATREVAQFVSGADQFISGLSVEMCVAMVGSLVWHATAPGTQNNYTASDVQNLGVQWYSTETGNSTNQNGMSLAQEQDMYTRMGLKFVALPISATSDHASDMANVTNALKQGYICAICGAETGFVYLNGDKVPYAWPPSGNHCIVATGIDSSGNFIVRDLASLVAADNYTPDTLQVYDNSKMDLVSGLAIIPSWLGIAMVPQVPESNANFDKEAQICWASYFNELENQVSAFAKAAKINLSGFSLSVPPINTGIYHAWYTAWKCGKQFGPALTHEYNSVNNQGKPIIVQEFAHARCEWSNGTARFYSSTGMV